MGWEGVQRSTKDAADSFNRFVEGGEGDSRKAPGVEPEQKDFWDSFGAGAGSAAAAVGPKKSSAIGTSAMKGMGGGGVGGGDAPAAGAKEDWENEKWD